MAWGWGDGVCVAPGPISPKCLVEEGRERRGPPSALPIFVSGCLPVANQSLAEPALGRSEGFARWGQLK